jgi:hypothetical protein
MGALFEPSTVALHGVFCSGLRGGSDAAILGTGNIGILAMQWAKIMGAKRVAVFDIFDERLDTCQAARRGRGVQHHARAAGWRRPWPTPAGKAFPYVFETAGQPATINIGFQLVCNKGRMTCVGTPHKDLTFAWKDWELLNRKEFHLTGTWMSYSAPFPGKEWELTAHYFAYRRPQARRQHDLRARAAERVHPGRRNVQDAGPRQGQGPSDQRHQLKGAVRIMNPILHIVQAQKRGEPAGHLFLLQRERIRAEGRSAARQSSGIRRSSSRPRPTRSTSSAATPACARRTSTPTCRS